MGVMWTFWYQTHLDDEKRREFDVCTIIEFGKNFTNGWGTNMDNLVWFFHCLHSRVQLCLRDIYSVPLFINEGPRTTNIRQFINTDKYWKHYGNLGDVLIEPVWKNLGFWDVVAHCTTKHHTFPFWGTKKLSVWERKGLQMRGGGSGEKKRGGKKTIWEKMFQGGKSKTFHWDGVEGDIYLDIFQYLT